MAVVTLTFTDEDLDTGRFKAELEVEGSKIDDGFMTAAHMTGDFIATHLSDPRFQALVLEWASEISSNPGCSIANAEHLPQISNDDADTSGAAA